MSLRQNLLNGVRNASGELPLRLVFWDGETFDFSSDPRVTLVLRSPSLVRHFLTGQIDRLGDAYVRVSWRSRERSRTSSRSECNWPSISDVRPSSRSS